MIINVLNFLSIGETELVIFVLEIWFHFSRSLIKLILFNILRVVKVNWFLFCCFSVLLII